jgi:hypothetical protein
MVVTLFPDDENSELSGIGQTEKCHEKGQTEVEIVQYSFTEGL